MSSKEKIQHEGFIRSLSQETLEVVIDSQSACAACHAKGACGMSDSKQKTIVVQRPEGDFSVGEKVLVCASSQNAYYSVFLAYIFPSLLIIATIFFIERSGNGEMTAAIASLCMLIFYFFCLYLFRNKISNKIKFTIEKLDN